MPDTTTKSADSSRRNFIRIGAGVVAGAVAVGGAEYVYLSGVSSNKNSTISSLRSQLATATSTVTSLTSQLATARSQSASLTSQISTLEGQLATAASQVAGLQSEVTSLGGQDALLTLGVQEAAVVEAAAEAIIPTDSNGPGAKEAGVIYFIDRQLNGDYGNNGRMYNRGPFIMPNAAGPLTVESSTGPITYSAGSPTTPWAAGQTYGYSMSLRNFWYYGIAALETYANTAYGGDFETLSAADQVAALSDLFDNKPAAFNGIIPSDFANELFFMVWSGFLMDPMYGGNRGMVGWVLTASPGLNNGNFYGEGFSPQQRMVASVPQILKPASLAQFQQAAGVAGVQGGT
jgi:hypothetical protein